MIVLGSKKLLLNHAFDKAILWGSQKKITVGYTSGPLIDLRHNKHYNIDMANVISEVAYEGSYS